MPRLTPWFMALWLAQSGFFWGVAGATAEPRRLTAQSPPHTVAFLELYTSEGCNSCPPADTWVRALASRGFGPDWIVPLGLHVDYWDYLGWPDRFAQSRFTQRQRALAAQQRQRTVYTPQLVLQGQDFRDWQRLGEHLQRLRHTPARANISLQVFDHAPAALEVAAEATVPDEALRTQAVMYVAVYENNLHSKVTVGENAGQTLQHDYVTRQWHGPFRVNTQGVARFQQRLPLGKDWQPANLGLAVFVQQQHSSDVLQALALPLGP